MIEIKNITKTFNKGTVNESKAIDDLSLVLNDGDFVTIIGSNGAGKSTLLNIIAGSIEADKGLVLLNGTSLFYVVVCVFFFCAIADVFRDDAFGGGLGENADGEKKTNKK